MRKYLLQAIGILCVCVIATLFLEYYDEHRIQERRQQEISQHLQDIQLGLQAAIAEVMEKNKLLAKRVMAYPDSIDDPERYGIVQEVFLPPYFLNLSFARGYTIVSTYPYEGHESLLGVNFLFRPHLLAAAQRAVRTRETVISSRVNLLPSGNQGVVVRTPLFDEAGEHFGFVSIALDLEELLHEVGYDSELGFELMIEAYPPESEPQMLRGHSGEFADLAAGPQVYVPEGGVWELRGKALDDYSEQVLRRGDYIRLLGVTITFFVLVVFLWRKGLLRGLNIFQRRLTLRLALLLVTVVPIVLFFFVIELLSIRSVFLFSQQQMREQARLLMRQVDGRIHSLFEIPRQVAFHADLFRQGILKTNNIDEVLGFFISQLRIQPNLTFLSLAIPDGQYYAVGRAPTGDDRNLRVQWAHSDTNQQIHVHWVNDSNQPSEEFIRGKANFDPRQTVWYQRAVATQSIKWYPVTQYGIEDTRQHFKGFGLGIAAPIYSAHGEFQGVIAADIALSIISEALEHLSEDYGGIIFLTEKNGYLLATSTQDPIYLEQETGIVRLTADESNNMLIRTAGQLIKQEHSFRGSQFIRLNGEYQLLSWQQVEVLDGPDLTLAVIIPSRLLASATHKIWRNALYMTWLLLVLGVLLALLSTAWISQPLQRLEHWASHLRQGRWDKPIPKSSPISEVRSLRNSLEEMAEQLHAHTEELEKLVYKRTKELRLANQKLHELSTIDGLTGLANRRYLDERARALWSLALQKKMSVLLLMVDVDYFKKYNDCYGHQAGDQCLESVAAVLRRYAGRAHDIVGRYGGEEFALIYVDYTAQEGIQLAERILQGVRALALEHVDSPFGQVTVSVGVAHTFPHVNNHVEQLFQQADKALYQAKENGRNCYVYGTHLL